MNTIMNRVFSSTLLVGLCVLLSACSVYRVRPLRKITRETAQYCAEKNGVSIYTAPIKKKELKYYFNNIALKQKQIIPVLVTVTNQSGKTVKIIPHNTHEIVHSIENQAAWNTTTTSTVGLLGIGLGYTMGTMTSIGLCTVAPAFILLAVPMVCAFPGVIIFCIGAGIHAQVMKKQFFVDFGHDLHNKCFDGEVQLDIGESATRLVFITSEQQNMQLSFVVYKKTDSGWRGDLMQLQVD